MNLVDLARTYVGLMDREPKQKKVSVTYGTAVSDSADGEVSVVMDGYTVTPPSGVEETVEIPVSEFSNGQYELPHDVFAGTVTVVDSYGNTLDTDEWQVDGNVLSIEAMVGARAVEVDYPASVTVTVTSDQFHEDAIALQFEATDTPTVIKGDEAVASTYSDGILTVDGASIESDAAFKVGYSLDLSIVAQFSGNVFQLPEVPSEVTLTGYSGETETEITGFTLEGSYITLTDTAEYDQYVVGYTVAREAEFNYSDTDDGSFELDGFPDSVAVEKNGEPFTDFTLDAGTLTVNWTPQEAENYRISYSAHVHLDLLTSDFVDGAYDLPTAPSGTVTVYIGDTAPAFELDGYTLTIPSLAGITHYTVTYDAKVSDGTVTLPCSPSVRAGEAVQVTVVGGTPIVTSVLGEGDRQDYNIEVAYDAAASAEMLAEEANTVASAVSQHFWHRSTDPDSDGAGTGAFVTDESQDDFLDAIASGTEPTTARPLHNLLMNAEGILLRAAKKIRAAFTPNGVAFYDGNGNSASNIVASFGSDAAHIGYVSGVHSSIYDGVFRVLDGEDIIGEFGQNVTGIFGSTEYYSGYLKLLSSNGQQSITLDTGGPTAVGDIENAKLDIEGGTLRIISDNKETVAIDSTDGLSVIDSSGNLVARFGASVSIGKTSAEHIVVDSDSMDFLDGTVKALSLENASSYAGMNWPSQVTVSGLKSGGIIVASKSEPYLWIKPNNAVSIGGTQPSRGAVRIDDNGVTIVPSLTLNNDLSVENGGTGASTAAAARNNLNAAAVSNQSAQNVAFNPMSGSTQAQGIYFNVTNTANTTYHGKRLGLLIYNDGLRFYNSTDANTPWGISGLSSTLNLGKATLVNNAYETITVWGRVVTIHVHGRTGTPNASGNFISTSLASYLPSSSTSTHYNISGFVADTSAAGHVARLWVDTSGNIKLAAVGYASSAAWYGTLTYIY